MASKIAELIIKALILIGFVCLGVFLFSIQCGFEWSPLLCACVIFAMIAIRVTLKD